MDPYAAAACFVAVDDDIVSTGIDRAEVVAAFCRFEIEIGESVVFCDPFARLFVNFECREVGDPDKFVGIFIVKIVFRGESFSQISECRESDSRFIGNDEHDPVFRNDLGKFCFFVIVEEFHQR